MPVELEMPELAESVIEGEIVKWLVKEGDHVAMDQLIVEVMTDKVTVEVPSPFEGVLLKQVAKEGEVVAIGKPIAIFGKEGETLPAGGEHVEMEHITPGKVVEGDAAASSTTAPASKPTPNGHAAVEPAGTAPQAAQAPAQTPSETATLSAFGKPMAAPAVRKLARELGVDLHNVRGSGDGGRIRSEDVKRVATAMGGATTSKAATPARQISTESGGTERVPLRGLRRAIADRMIQSKHTAAHTLHVDEADLTDLVALRASAKELAAARGVKLTYLPFFVRAVCYALKKYPYMNSSLDDAAHEIVLKKDYNIGIAANTDNGLVVPVVHHADRLTIFELANAINALADKARAGKLAHDDIAGGTFTITNVGSVGGLFTFPVINYPEVGILGTHGIQERPVVRNGQIVIRHMMYLSISFDHRVVDGALAARFVREVADYLASPALMLM
ncbi:MAG TPA: dihydrolipoamide acetyltransferase family protein, partial [Candidatus Eremiobacteraceae bacterium]|nr:dihydrolipoamide acetyltransferase family protein [Candidatus Eremiobacteraceae bacterium]